MNPRKAALLAIILFFAVLSVFLPPLYQDPAYHLFSDQREFLGIPRFFDVLSNLPFLLVGALGTQVVLKSNNEPMWKFPFLIFFLSVAWVALGSGYYHWAPTSQRLFWDRLPMSVAFMALLGGLVADRIHLVAGFRSTFPLVAVGVWSVLHWHLGNAEGRGDLRFYFVVQFGTILLFPVILWLFPKNRSENRFLLWAALAYVAAKFLEAGDHVIFGLGGWVSGHSLKHLAAAFAPYFIYRMIRERVISTNAR